MAQCSALCPQPGEEGPSVCRAGCRLGEGGLLMGSRLCWMGSPTSQTQGWEPALCSDDGITVSVRNTSSPSLQPYPYSALGAFMSRTGLQVPTEKQVDEWRTLTLGNPEISADAPSVMPSVAPICSSGTWCSLLKGGPKHQALQPTQTLEAEE